VDASLLKDKFGGCAESGQALLYASTRRDVSGWAALWTRRCLKISLAAALNLAKPHCR
jgi:hypothetical protein